jgi:ABC-type branched-subunit amino acid transport system substrate-binding protein
MSTFEIFGKKWSTLKKGNILRVENDEAKFEKCSSNTAPAAAAAAATAALAAALVAAAHSRHLPSQAKMQNALSKHSFAR